MFNWSLRDTNDGWENHRTAGHFSPAMLDYQPTNQPTSKAISGKGHRRVKKCLYSRSRTTQRINPMIQMVPETLRPCISAQIEYLDNWTAISCPYIWQTPN